MFRLKLKSPKIKLVAIAKDEAAYITDWIFHHLYFGFDHITVYVNNTSDNTMEIAAALSSLKNVEFKNGDKFFKDPTSAPQITVYRHELLKSRWQGYTHVMFLDIDEFFTARDFSTKIGEFIKTINTDVCCLEWVHKMAENQPFSPPFEASIAGRKAPQVKSIVATYVEPQQFTPHNVFSPSISYSLADHSEFLVTVESFSKVNVAELNKPLKAYFVLHRMLRHQIEYIAALKRGRPIHANKITSVFKDNRNGIFDDNQNITIDFSEKPICKYLEMREIFLHEFGLLDEVTKGQKSVSERYVEVLQMIATAPIQETLTLRKILRNVTLAEVQHAFEMFLEHNQVKADKIRSRT